MRNNGRDFVETVAMLGRGATRRPPRSSGGDGRVLASGVPAVNGVVATTIAVDDRKRCGPIGDGISPDRPGRGDGRPFCRKGEWRRSRGPPPSHPLQEEDRIPRAGRTKNGAIFS